jgi:hypothetical protein
MALALAAAGAARADTYNPVYCGSSESCGGGAPQAGNPGQAGAPPPAPTGQPVGPSLPDQLRQQLSGSAPTGAQKQQAIARVNSALQRMNAVVAAAGQSTDPQAQAQLRQQYAAALADLRKGIGQVEAFTSDPAERAKYQDWEQQTEQQLAQQLVQAGLFGAPAPVANAAVQQIGGNLRNQLRQSLSQSDQPATHMVRQQCRDGNGVLVPNCFYQLVDGQCMKQTLGQVGWDPTPVPTDQCPSDLKQAYCQQYPQLSAGICPTPKPVAAAKVPPAGQGQANADPAPAGQFTMGDPSDTAREIQRLTRDPSEEFLRQLPPECAALFGGFLMNTYSASAKGSAVGTPESRQHDTQMATEGYGELDASPECREVIKRIAAAHGLGLPARRLSARVRGAFDAAMAADPNAPIGAPSGWTALQDTGYDPSEVLDFGMALLDLAGGFAGVAGAMHNVPHIGGGVRPAPSSPAQYPRAISCNYSGCVTTGGSGPSASQSTVTGVGSR